MALFNLNFDLPQRVQLRFRGKKPARLVPVLGGEAISAEMDGTFTVGMEAGGCRLLRLAP